jgi:hypothetical protein
VEVMSPSKKATNSSYEESKSNMSVSPFAIETIIQQAFTKNTLQMDHWSKLHLNWFLFLISSGKVEVSWVGTARQEGKQLLEPNRVMDLDRMVTKHGKLSFPGLHSRGFI